MKSISKKNNPDISYIPRIVLKFHDDFVMPYGGDQEINSFLLEKKIISWQQMLQKFPGITVTKLYSAMDPSRIGEMVAMAKKRNASYKPPNFLTYFAIDFPNEKDKEELLNEIWKDKNIEYAYKESVSVYPPSAPATTNGSGSQAYLDAAPAGINARFAWEAGGDGSHVNFIDIEQGWDLNHIGIPGSVHLLSGDSVNFFGHGTAVLGIVLAEANDTGCVGIAPKVNGNVISQARPTVGSNKIINKTSNRGVFVQNISDALMAGLDVLQAGDVLLLESQIAFDAGNGAGPEDYPPEIESAIFNTIQLLTESGIIVIEPSGDAGRSLDRFKDDSGKLILKRTNRIDFKDSGAIMVGSSHSGNPHSRDSGSNYGSRIDCYSWGENIKTIGDELDGHSTTAVTPDFNGTSGASAILAGVAIAVQSMRKATRQPVFSPGKMRDIFSDPANGTPSKNKKSDKIGPMPDLKKIWNNVINHP